MPRISSILKQRIQDYIASKIPNTQENYYKKEFFQSIFNEIENKTLSIVRLVQIFNGLNLSSKPEVFHSDKKAGADVNSTAAKLLRDLFAELGQFFDDELWKNLIETNNKIENNDIQKIIDLALASLVNAQKLNPYAPGPRLRLEHELKGILNLPVNTDDSLALALYTRYLDFESALPYLKYLQNFEVCSVYIPELLYELMHLYLEPLPKNALAIQKIKVFVTQAGIDGATQKLQQQLLQSHPEIAGFLFAPVDVPSSPAEHNVGDIKLELKQQVQPAFHQISKHMRQEVQRRLLLKARTDAKMRVVVNDIQKQFQPDAKKKDRKFVATVVGVVAEKAKPHLDVLKQRAILRIRQYLNPNRLVQISPEKHAFFTRLLIKIDAKEFKLADLFVDIPNFESVFAKTIGRTRSRAADCLKDVFFLMMGRRMTSDEVTILVNSGKFPKVADSVLNSYVTNVTKGDMPKNRVLAQTIMDGMTDVKTSSQIQQQVGADFYSRAEAAYQKKLMEIALAKLKDKDKECRFDVQGHVLVEAKLEDSDYEALNKELTGSEQSPDLEVKTAYYYKNLLGTAKGNVTYCSLDGIATDADSKVDLKDAKSQIPELQVRFKGWVLGGISGDQIDEIGLKLSLAVDKFIGSPSRSSVIPLQEEMEMHLRMAMRPFKDVIPLNQWTKALAHALLAINQEVKKCFALALYQSYVPATGTIDFVLLNKELDKARAVIAPLSKRFFLKQLPDDAKLKIRQHLANPDHPITQHTFEQMTATGLDYFRTDARNQTAVRIRATDETAHNKVKDKQASRSLHRNVYSCKNDKLHFQPLSVNRAEMRVPSIALKGVDHKTAVDDVKTKLATTYKELQNQLGGYEGPMTYNLLTSLHSKTWDLTIDRSNAQRKSAARIHKGAHAFNRDQVLAGNLDSLCYVQNIAVNQHTTNLRYEEEFVTNDVIGESTLMAEMAMLSNFTQHAHVFPPAMATKLISTYRAIQIEYIQFLKNNEQGHLYFKNSAEGKAAVSHLKELKQYLCTNAAGLKTAVGDSLSTLVVKALVKCMSNDYHWADQFGMLMQALSVFVERASQFGCKSANERYQGVSGRVDLLVSMAERSDTDLSVQEKAIVQALKSFLDQSNEGPAQLQKAVDEAYNQHNLYGAAAAVSLEDQGAASKVVASKNSDEKSGAITTWEWLTNTNVAESRHLIFCSQKKAAQLQAHKKDHAEEWKAELNGPASAG